MTTTPRDKKACSADPILPLNLAGEISATYTYTCRECVCVQSIVKHNRGTACMKGMFLVEYNRSHIHSISISSSHTAKLA